MTNTNRCKIMPSVELSKVQNCAKLGKPSHSRGVGDGFPNTSLVLLEHGNSTSQHLFHQRILQLLDLVSLGNHLWDCSWMKSSLLWKQNTQINDIQCFLGQNIEIPGRWCIWMFFSRLHFICQSRVGLDWNGLAAWYFVLYFHFQPWLGNCFEEREGDAAQHWKLKSCLLRNAKLHKIWFLSREIQISAATNPDFWGNKSWRLREKSVLMLMQEVGAPVRAHLSRWSMEDDTVPFPKDPNMPAILSAYSFYSFGPNFHPHNSSERSLNHPISKTMYIHDLKSPIQ